MSLFLQRLHHVCFPRMHRSHKNHIASIPSETSHLLQVPRTSTPLRGIPPSLPLNGKRFRRWIHPRLPQHGLLGFDAQSAHRSGESPSRAQCGEFSGDVGDGVSSHSALAVFGGCRWKDSFVPGFVSGCVLVGMPSA